MGDLMLTGRSYAFRRAFVAHAVPEYEAERAAEQFLAFFQEPAFTYDTSALRALYGSTQGRLLDEWDVDRMVDLLSERELPPPLALCHSRTLGWWLVALYSSNASALRMAKTDGSVDWLDRITNAIVRIRRPRAPGLQCAAALDRGGERENDDEREQREEEEQEENERQRLLLPWRRVEPDQVRTRRRVGVALCRDPWLDSSLPGFKPVPVFSPGSWRLRDAATQQPDALWLELLGELERLPQDDGGEAETRLLIHPRAFAACIVCRYEPSQPESVATDLLRMMCSLPREYYFDVTWTDEALCDALVALLAGECVERDFVLYRRPLKLVHRARAFNLLSSPRLVVRDETVSADVRRACLLRETLDSSTLSATEDRFWTESLVSTVGGARDKPGPRLTRKLLCGAAVTWLDAATAALYHDDALVRHEQDPLAHNHDSAETTTTTSREEPALCVWTQRGRVRLHGAGRLRVTAWRDPQTSEDDPDLYDRSKWTSSEVLRLTANEAQCAEARSAAVLFYERHLNLVVVPRYNRAGFTHALLLLQSQNVRGDLRVVVEDTLSENELRALLEAVLGAVEPPVAVHFVCYVRRRTRSDSDSNDEAAAAAGSERGEDWSEFAQDRGTYALQYPRYRCAPESARAELDWSEDPFAAVHDLQRQQQQQQQQRLATAELPVVHETTLTRERVDAWMAVENYAPASALEEDAVKRTCVLLALKYPCRFSAETREFALGLPARWHDASRPFLALTRVPMGLENRRDGHLNHYLRVPCHGDLPEALERVQKKVNSVAWGNSRSTVIMKGQTDGGVDYTDRLLEIVACHLLGHTTSAPLPTGDTERLLSRLGERLPLALVPYAVNESSLVKSVLKELPYLDVLYEHMPVHSLYYDEAVVAGFVLSRLGSAGGLDLTAAAGCVQTLMRALYPSPRSDWLLEWFLERTPHETDMAAYVVQTSRVKQLRDNVFVLERSTHSCFLNTLEETPEVYAPVERALRAWMGDEPMRAYARAFGPVYVLEEPSRTTPLRRLGDMRLWRVHERVPSQQTPLAVRSGADGVVLLFSGYAPCYTTGRRFFRWSSTKPLLGLFTTKTRHEVRKATPQTSLAAAEDRREDADVEETRQKLFNTHLSLPYGTEFFIGEAFVETRYDARVMSARLRACVSLTRETDADEFHRREPCRTVNAYASHAAALWHSLTTDAEGVTTPTAAACSEALRLVTARVSDAYVRRKQPQGAVTHWHGGFAVGSESADAVLGLDEENRCSYRVEKVCARAQLRVEASFELYRDATLQLYAKKLFLWGAACFVRCFTVVRYQPLADAYRPHDLCWEEDADTLSSLYARRAFLRVATRFTFSPDEYRAYAADGSELRDWPHDRELDEGCVLSKRSRGDWAAHYTLLAPSRTGLFAALVLLLQQTADYVKVVLEIEGLETLCIQYALEAAALFGYRPKRVLVLGRAAAVARTALLTRSPTLRLQRHLLRDDDDSDSDSESEERRVVLQLDGEPTGLMMELMEATRGELEWIGAKVEEQPWDYRVVRTRDPDTVVLETDLGREWGRYGPADVDSGFLEAVRAAGVVRYRDPLNGTPAQTWFERVSMTDGDLRRLVRGLDAGRLAYSYSAAELARASNALLDSNLTSYADALSLSERLTRLTSEFERAFSLSADVATARRLSGVNAYERRTLSACLDRAASVLQVVPAVTRLTTAYMEGPSRPDEAATSFTKTLRVAQSTETLRDGTLTTTLRFAADGADRVSVRLPSVRLLWTSEANEWLSRAGLQVVVGARAELLAPTLERPYPLLTCERSLDSCVLTLWFAHGLCGEEPTLTARTSEEADFFLAAVRLFVATYDLVAGSEKATTFLHVNVAMGATAVDSVRQAYLSKLTQPFVGDINGDTLYRFSVKRDSSSASSSRTAAERDRPPRALSELTKALKRWVLAAAASRPRASALRDYWLETFSAIEDDVPHSHRWLGRLLLSPYAPEQASALEALSKYWNRYHIFLGWPR